VTSEIAARSGTVACFCQVHGHPGVTCDGRRKCATCEPSEIPGWRLVYGADVYGFLRRLEHAGLVVGTRSPDRQEVEWAIVVKADT